MRKLLSIMSCLFALSLIAGCGEPNWDEMERNAAKYRVDTEREKNADQFRRDYQDEVERQRHR